MVLSWITALNVSKLKLYLKVVIGRKESGGESL